MINDKKKLIIDSEKSSDKCYLPARYVLVGLMFMAMSLEYAQRVCLSMAIVVMVNHTALEPKNATTEEYGTCPVLEVFNQTESTKQGRYLWSPAIQGVILGGYFYGYVCTQIVGGRMAELFGGKWPLGLSVLLGSILTLLTPIAADAGVAAITLVRIAMGLIHGISFPTAFAILAHWSPPEEKSTLVSVCVVGDHVGTVLSMPVVAYLCEHGFAGGWPSVFYILGLLGCVWFLFWAVLAFSKPSDHPRISKQEIEYIQKGNNQMKEDQKLPVPWSKVLTSMPVWSVTIAFFTVAWGSTTLLTKLPAYLEFVLHVSIQKNGFVNALAYFVSSVTLLLSGYLADYLSTKKGLPSTKVRKGFQIIATVGPALCTGLIPSIGCEKAYAITLLTLSMGFLGMCGGGLASIVADMAPHHSATVFGLVNGLGYTAGIFSPLVAGLILDESHGSTEQWNLVFYLSAAIYLVGGLNFLIFASGERQSWAQIPERNQIFKTPETQKDIIVLASPPDNVEISS